MTTELVHASLLEALRWIGSEQATGSIKVGGSEPGSLFFDSGRLYFGMVDGRPMSGSELANAGIDRALWQQASTRPGARLNFVEELLAVGCEHGAVERFIRQRLETTIETMGLDAGPVEVARGRHGFGAAITFAPEQLVDMPVSRRGHPQAIDDDSLVSLASVAPTSSVTIDGRTWNLLVGLFSPARFAELSHELGIDSATKLVSELSTRSLLNVVESHQPSESWGFHTPEIDEATPPPAKPSLFDAPQSTAHPSVEPDPAAAETQHSSWDDDSDEYVPDKVGRQAYAAMASMRASVAEPAPQEKARALRRLIEAVKGL